MLCTREFLIAVVEKSAHFSERLKPRFVPCPAPPGDRTLLRQRMDRWLRNAALGSAEDFEKRLAWDGLTLQDAQAIAAGVRLTDPDAPLPEWTETLREALRACEPLAGTNPRELSGAFRFLEQDEPYAFEHLMVPFVLQASRRARKRFPRFDTILTDRVAASLERFLLQWLCAVAEETIELEFSVFKAARQQGTALGAIWTFASSAGASTTLYDAFVVQMWTGGLLAFFAEYAALARLLARLADMWVNFVVEFLERFERDLPELELTFHNGEALGRIVEATPGLSDRHNHGLTSIRVRFEEGPACIYKPKNLGSERAYYELLAWFNAHGAPLSFHVFQAVYRPTYGWVEIVEPRPCESQAEVDRYYQRAGILLCLIYALEGSDCHHENLIASGEYPVLIDMETLLQPRVAMVEGTGEEGAASVANRVFYWDSVFRTAMLPRWEFGPNGESYDVSGLGGVEGQRTSFRRKVWQHINTDAMKLKKEVLHTHPHLNLVRLNGRQCFPADYVGPIVDGFERMYRFLSEQSGALFAPAGPLAAMGELPVRFIYRHTKVYTAVLNTCLLPQYLRDGMDASIQVDVLCRPLLHTETRHPFWPLYAAEHAALLQADIPLFGASAASTALALGEGRSIPGFFAEPGFELLKRRFSKLNAGDLERQVRYIRSCFDTGAAGAGPTSVHAGGASAAPSQTDAVLSPEDLKREALAIARQIRRAAIHSNDGSATWVTLAYYPEAQRWQLQPMSPRLYDGACGTALFLSALEAATGGAGFRALALSAFKTSAAYLAHPGYARVLFEPGIGAGLGGASLIYGFALGAELLGEELLLEDAICAARLLTPQCIDEDRRFDLLGGAAGALVALLTLYRTRSEPWLVERAVDCARHLLMHRTESPFGPRAWKTLGGKMLAGFSHGAAGIAYALNRLYEVTGHGDFRAAAVEACAYEAGLFSPERGNWPDLRYPAGNAGYSFQSTWCHGAPGIGLGRAGSYHIADGGDRRGEIEQAMATTIRAGIGGVDHLCCGNLGLADALLTAGRKLDRADWQSEARKLAGAVVRRARQAGGYRLGWNSVPYISSFHQGMAGIGYELLRFADPGQIRSVLLWE